MLKTGIKRIVSRVLPLLAMAILSSCTTKPLLTYSLETPPLVLVPARLASVEDGRSRFREIYCAVQKDHGSLLPNDRPCEDALQRLSGEATSSGRPVWLGKARMPMKIIIVPGLFNECISGITWPFSRALGHIETFGFATAIIPVSGRSSSERNARQIREALLAIPLGPHEKLVLVGYSKGTPDILEAIVTYSELAQKVSAVVSVTGVVGGSPIADALSWPLPELIRHLPLPSCSPGDGEAIESLKRSTRQLWLSRHELPRSIAYFSLGAFDERQGISALLRKGYDDLSTIDPRNDGQVIFTDSLIPGATLMGYAKADHWAVAMNFTEELPGPVIHTFIDKNAFPREVLFESIIRFVEESLLNGS